MMNLTIKQLMTMANFAGLVIDEDKSFHKEDRESFIETEFTLQNGVEVQDEETKVIYNGLSVYCSEYPEEGCLPLDDKTKYI